jgi:hypothetical protein
VARDRLAQGGSLTSFYRRAANQLQYVNSQSGLAGCSPAKSAFGRHPRIPKP